MVTDPPYGVDYDPAWRKRAGVNLNKRKLGKVANDDRADWREAWALFPGSVAYVWHAGLHASAVQDSLEAVGLRDAGADHLGQGPLRTEPRPLSLAARAVLVRCPRHGRPAGAATASNRRLWPINAREDHGHGHGTQKPVECMKRPIENNSSPGQAVYEPFSGSGTTIIAAEMTGRSCLCDRTRSGLCRCRGPALAGVHGRGGRHWKVTAASPMSRRERRDYAD